MEHPSPAFSQLTPRPITASPPSLEPKESPRPNPPRAPLGLLSILREAGALGVARHPTSLQEGHPKAERLAPPGPRVENAGCKMTVTFWFHSSAVITTIWSMFIVSEASTMQGPGRGLGEACWKHVTGLVSKMPWKRLVGIWPLNLWVLVGTSLSCSDLLSLEPPILLSEDSKTLFLCQPCSHFIWTPTLASV